jgi:hypothetical protein
METKAMTIKKRTVQLTLIVVGLLLTLSGCKEEKADSSCDDLAAYGPPPCTSDAQCVDENGSGWYCDKDYVVQWNEECSSTFPTCVAGTDAGIDTNETAVTSFGSLK